MNTRQIDTAARLLGSGLPRRQILGLLAKSAMGGAMLLAFGSPTSAKPACRREGHPCEGNQTCCAGLICAASGPGAAKRCTAGKATECAGDCPTAESAVVVVGRDVDIEAECTYSGEMRRTSCTFSAAAGDETVRSVTVPTDILCAQVVGGDFEEVDLSAITPATGTGLKSTRQEEGTAAVTVELDGEVTSEGTATYWCETDRPELVPVTGPGLHCAENPEPTATSLSGSTGAVVVHAYRCDVASDATDTAWFDVCRAPATQSTFQLAPSDGEPGVDVQTQSADGDGICHFGQLPPGTYKLQQTNGDWCHAESDSVDDQGDVVVKAAEVATVWIFFCQQTTG